MVEGFGADPSTIRLRRTVPLPASFAHREELMVDTRSPLP